MKTLLHILTRPADTLVLDLVAATGTDPTVRVETVDLNADDPDYAALVDRIFSADEIATW